MKYLILILLMLISQPINTIYQKCILYLTEQESADIKLIARVIEAEASVCPFWEKKLVGSTIMNRLDHCEFPNNVKNIITQKSQYYNINIKPSESSMKAAIEVLLKQNTNNKVLYFYKPGHGFKRKNILIKTKYHHYAT